MTIRGSCCALLLGALLVGGCGDRPEEAEPPAERAALEDLQRQLASSDTAQQREAVREIGELAAEDARAMELLVNLLADQNATLAAEAQAALQRAGPAAVSHLTEALGSDLSNMRAGALLVLGRIGEGAADATDEIAQALREDPDWSVRYRAAEALGALGPAAATQADALRDALDDEDANVRLAAQHALARVAQEAPADSAAPADTTGG